MVDAAPAGDTTALCAEVGLVVSKVRSRRELDVLELPDIDQVAAATGLTREELLAQSVPLVTDDAYRRFLELLLPFPLPAQGRWPALGRRHVSDDDTGRGVGAGYAVFGISSWDGLNARTDELGGRSRREIAEEMLAVAIRRREADGIVATGAAPTGSRRRLVVVALVAAAMVAVAGVAGIVLVDGSDGADRSVEAEEPAGRAAVEAETTIAESCGRVGDTAELTEPWTPASAAAAIEAAAASARSGLATICPLGPASSWDDLVVQEIDHPESPSPAALVAVPDAPSVYLPPAIYAGYHQIGGKDGSKAQGIAGFPLEVTEHPDGHVEATFSGGVLLVGESFDAPFFWIWAPFVEWWHAHSELGLPTSNPMPDLTQHFQHGEAKLDLAAAGGVPVANVITAREEGLPEPRAERILHQGDGTSWWVDADDRRHWIADIPTWECLGGEAVMVPDDVAGWAIAALPAGDLAECG